MSRAPSRTVPLVLVALMAGCSKPNEATEPNLRRALEPLVADAFCRPVPGATLSTAPPGAADPTFPILIRASADRDFGSTTQGRAALEAATAAGLLQKRALNAPARNRGSSDPLVPTALLAFTPTEGGKEVFRVTAATQAAGGSEASACMAKGAVEKVVRWTEPVETPVGRLVRVTYVYGPTDVPKALGGSPAQVAAPKEASVMLVQTNDGWAKTGR